MGKLKNLYLRHETEVLVIGGAVVLWKTWGIFSALGKVGDGVGDAVATATASLRDAAEKANDKVKVKNVNPTATDADVSVFKADAKTLAAAMGRLPGIWSNWAYPDRDAVLKIARKYSHFLLDAKGNPIPIKGTNTYMVRKASLRLGVLVSLYSDLTNGRDMWSDMDGAMRLRNDDMNKKYFKYLR